jgi:hypothetical protein
MFMQFNKYRSTGMKLVDLDREAVVKVRNDRFTIEEIQRMHEGKTVAEATLTAEYQALLNRLASVPASTMSTRKASMNQVEFDNNVFAPAVYEDYDTDQIIGHH